MNELRVVVKEPNDVSIIKFVDDDLSTWQDLVKGYIEVVPYNYDLGIFVICNEEGKLKGFRPNIKYYDDILVGTIVFVGCNEEGEFVGLNDEQVVYVVVTANNGGIR